MSRWLRPSLDWLLVFVPIAAIANIVAPQRHVFTFVTAGLAIIPLAGSMGTATGQLARRTGEGVGGMLNATFGNAAELIIGLLALKEGLFPVVKASLTGSIIGNVLLVLGAAFLAGGIRFKKQSFHGGGARIQSTMLTLASIALILPAAFHHLSHETRATEVDLSLEMAVVLLITYAFGLLFTLHTHRDFFAGQGEPPEKTANRAEPWRWSHSLLLLGVSTGLIAWMSEILVGSVRPAAETLGMTDLFIGVIVIAVIGNAAEHSTAVMMAVEDRMDLSLGIALGSSIQIALFVAPVLLFASYWIAPRPMDLVFTPIEVLAVFLAVILANEISQDGESNWLEGLQLLAVYVLLGLVFFFMPAAGPALGR